MCSTCRWLPLTLCVCVSVMAPYCPSWPLDWAPARYVITVQTHFDIGGVSALCRPFEYVNYSSPNILVVLLIKEAIYIIIPCSMYKQTIQPKSEPWHKCMLKIHRWKHSAFKKIAKSKKVEFFLRQLWQFFTFGSCWTKLKVLLILCVI